MSKSTISYKNPIYNISDATSAEELYKTCHALGSKERIAILNLIQTRPMTIKELSQILNLPVSSITLHTNILNEGNLINIEYKPNKKGLVKLCSRAVNTILILIDNVENNEELIEQNYEMPIGNFTDINIKSPCGIAGKYSGIGEYDEISTFYLPNRHKAELLWFSDGDITYKFPNTIKDPSNVNSIEFSLEICSETLYSRNDWPSDITFWINDKEITTWTSPGDFGGRRGKYTPDYWFINSTQYGILKNIKIDKNGIYLDNNLISNNLTLDDINLMNSNSIDFKIGIKPDAVHKGGINIFGKNFGDHDQAIIMKVVSKKK